MAVDKARLDTTRSADAIDRAVGERIAARRAALGLSQSALGARLGVSFQQLQKYEAGLNRVSASRLHRLAQALGVSVGDFFPDTEAGSGAATDPSDELADLRVVAASSEGRRLLSAFRRIEQRPVRRALARIATALATPD